MKPLSFRKMQWLFPVVVALHNGEEAFFMPKWVAAHRGQLLLHPRAGVILPGLLVVALAAVAISILSFRRGKESVWTYLLFGCAATMLVNVFVPHVPATLAFREYTPGVVTAVLINLPFMSVFMVTAVHDHWVSGTRALRYALLVPLAIGGSILVLFAIT
jgi:thiamine transporter ThiT